MMTSSNGTIFRVTGPLCGEFTGPGEFPAQRPVTRSFDVFFDLRLNKRLSKQPWGWWFESPPWSLRRHCNAENVDHRSDLRVTYDTRSLAMSCYCSYRGDWIFHCRLFTSCMNSMCLHDMWINISHEKSEGETARIRHKCNACSRDLID